MQCFFAAAAAAAFADSSKSFLRRAHFENCFTASFIAHSLRVPHGRVQPETSRFRSRPQLEPQVLHVLRANYKQLILLYPHET